jgi:hypothetical protein
MWPAKNRSIAGRPSSPPAKAGMQRTPFASKARMTAS